MFCIEHNFFAGRKEDGTVRFLRFKQTPERRPEADASYPSHAVDVDFEMGPGVWASIVASVSRRGEDNGRYYIAKAFHMNEGLLEVKGMRGG